MQPRVVAILVVRTDERFLDRSLAALAAQTRVPDVVLVVDARGVGSAGSLALARPPVLTVTARNFLAAVGQALPTLPPATDAEWLWLLPGDSAPEPGALAALLAAVEIAPSVAIAGPKLVDPADRALLRSFGESLTRFGAAVPLVEDDLDQAQHDTQDDVLGVAAPGALVRRALWDHLGGGDPGLPAVDAGLDLSIRARLAGARVVRVPAARVAVETRPEDFGRRAPLTPRAHARLVRRAQLHRRLVYAPTAALPVHWLLLLPIALLRGIGSLILKRPGAIGGEVTAALAAAFDGTVPGARRRLRRSRRVGWLALAPLRLSGEVVRERRAALRDRAAARRAEPDVVRASFLPGGLAVVTAAALLGLVISWRFIGAPALEGGALLPLSPDLGTLWSRLGWGLREGTGGAGPADPFVAVLAVLGSLTAWNPSVSLVVLWVLALPVAALGAWWCATRLSERAWPPVVAAALWSLAPPLLAALGEGRPGAVLTHLLLPWLAFAVIEGARSWSAAATAALLFAVVTAATPVLFPALVVAVVFWAVVRPRAMIRLLGIPLPAIALFAPLIVAQFVRGTPLGLVADPGPVAAFPAASGWQLLIGLPTGDADGWESLTAAIGMPGGLGVLAPAVLLVPFAATALLALFLPGARRAIPATVLALIGLATAVASAQIDVAFSGTAAVGPWPGAGLSLYWLGLIGAVIVALEALGRAAIVPGLAVLLTSAVAVVPLLAAPIIGTTAVAGGDGQVVPALVTAEAANDPGLQILVLTPQPDGSLAARLDSGSGRWLDGTSTFASTRSSVGEEGIALAELAGNLSSRSGYDPTSGLQQFEIGFILLAAGADEPAADEVRQRAAEALDADGQLESVGDTAYGRLWTYPALESEPAPDRPGSSLNAAILTVQALVFAFVLLLALPTRRMRRAVRPVADFSEDDGGFDEDDHG